jgi:hypothetical protein
MASTDVVIETREDLKKALKESPVEYTEDRYYIPHDGVTGARKEDIKSMFNLVK